MTLHRKAFLALAALLVALLLIFAGFSRLGLQRGLGPYVAEIELARMGWLAERLQSHYTQTGGWDRLRNQPALWSGLSHPGSGRGCVETLNEHAGRLHPAALRPHFPAVLL